MSRIKSASTTLIRLFEFPQAWVVIVIVLSFDTVWQLSTTWVPPQLSRIIFLPLMSFLFVKYLYDKIVAPGSGVEAPVWVNSISKRFFLGTEFFFLFLCGGFAFAFLSYLMCSLNFPLMDQQLDQLDKLLGFQWLPWYEWSKDKLILNAAYHCLGYEMLFFVGYCTLFLNKERLVEIFWLLFIVLIITVPVSGIFPGYGPLYLYKLISTYNLADPEIYDSFVHVNLIRDGKSPDLMHGFKGIILFPSFHAACAVCYSYCFRNMGVIGYTMLWLNIFMLASTPFFGGHYLVDVIAGILIAFIAIIVLNIFKKLRH